MADFAIGLWAAAAVGFAPPAEGAGHAERNESAMIRRQRCEACYQKIPDRVELDSAAAPRLGARDCYGTELGDRDRERGGKSATKFLRGIALVRSRDFVAWAMPTRLAFHIAQQSAAEARGDANEPSPQVGAAATAPLTRVAGRRVGGGAARAELGCASTGPCLARLVARGRAELLAH